MDFNECIKDAFREFWKIDFISIILDVMLIFLLFVTLLKFLQISWIFGIFPAVFYLLFRIIREINEKSHIFSICKKCPEIDEKLKTACDNRANENFVVKKLLSDVSSELENLEASLFLDTKKVSTRIFAIVLVAILFMTISAFDFNVKKIDFVLQSSYSKSYEFFDKFITYGKEETILKNLEKSNYSNERETNRVGGGDQGGKIPGFSKGPLSGIGGGAGIAEDANIFGEKGSAKIYGEDIQMQVYPEYGGDIKIKEERTRKPSSSFSITEAKGSELPEEEPLEYEEIIRRYFEKILSEEKK